MNESYKLVGILSLFGLVPDFVFPIFEKDNKYYFLVVNEEELKIEDFEEVKTSTVEKINFLTHIKSNLSEEIILTRKSKPIFAFQQSYGQVYIGFFKEFKEFFETYEADNDVLKNIIEDFFDVAGTKA